MPPSKPDFTVREVVAVREDPGRPPKVIPQRFELRIRCSPQGLVLFRLDISFTDSASTKTTVYLRITADSLDSLDRTDYDKTNANTQTPPYLEDVCNRLNDMNSVTRLRFRLRGGEGFQLVVPLDFDVDKILGNTARSAFEGTESLAAASWFSLYFQHDLLTRENLSTYKRAVPSSTSLEALRKLYKGMRSVNRLYNGIGGKVHIPRDHRRSPPSRERCSSPASATTASCGSTLAFETDPRLPESPPPYAEYLHVERSPRVRSDDAAAAIFAKSPAGGLAPPEYGDTEQPYDVLDLSPPAFCGKQDINTHATPKRKRSFAAVCSPRTTARGASHAAKIPPSISLDSDDENNAARFLHLFELQRQQLEQQRQQLEQQRQQLELQRQQLQLQHEQIEHLQKDVGELQRWNKKLEGLHDELEADCLGLETRQDQADDAINNLSVEVSELEDKYVEVVHQIPDVCDEFKDLKENIGDTFKEDMCKLIEDSMAKQIVECVEAQADEVKRKIRQALQ
ncbi:hypothetical protein LZ30DRAFT_735287 [Colletotrichum cereale]|nr:hypothetical protein LZ30DRAFT_735287 [Colletotrichum cereale]